MKKFFVPEDFKTVRPELKFQDWIDNVTAVANAKLEKEGIVGHSQKHRGAWHFTERKMMHDTHRAILLNLEEINENE